MTILLVDDNYEFAKRMSELLSELSVVGKQVGVEPRRSRKNYWSANVPFFSVGYSYAWKKRNRAIKLIKTRKNRVVIIDRNQEDKYHRNLCGQLAAEYFVDKTNDFSSIPRVIS